MAKTDILYLNIDQNPKKSRIQEYISKLPSREDQDFFKEVYELEKQKGTSDLNIIELFEEMRKS